MSERKWGPAVPVLWFIFIISVIAIAFLSFESGAQSKELGEKIVLRICAKLKPEHVVTEDELFLINYVFRQSARIFAFLVLGMLGTITIHASMRRAGWFAKTIVSGGVLFVIAYVTERFKEYIPGRHYSYKEMLLSMIAAAAGFMFVSLVSLLKQMITWLFQRLKGHI